MNHVVARIARAIPNPFRQRTPVSRAARIRRRVERFVGVMFLAYLALMAYPQVLFAHSLSAHGITFYSREPLPAEAALRAARAAELVNSSELSVPGRTERVFVCDKPWLFRLFGPLSGGAFAFSTPVTDHVFVCRADFQNDIIRNTQPQYNTRSLSAVIAHEITHGLIRKRVGLLRSASVPDWVAEGYCDYVALEGSFPEAEGMRLLRAGESHPSKSFQYFLGRQMIRHLIEAEQQTFDQIVSAPGQAAEIEVRLRGALETKTAP